MPAPTYLYVKKPPLICAEKALKTDNKKKHENIILFIKELKSDRKPKTNEKRCLFKANGALIG